MMEKNYQLVAWTRKITDRENARLYMIPSLECEVQADLVTDLTFIRQEEYKFDGPVSLDLARRAVRAYEKMSEFETFAWQRNPGVKISFRRLSPGSCSKYTVRLPKTFLLLNESSDLHNFA